MDLLLELVPRRVASFLTSMRVVHFVSQALSESSPRLPQEDLLSEMLPYDVLAAC